MPTILKVRPGLSAPLVNSIPEDWDRQWFRRWITDFLGQPTILSGSVTFDGSIGINGNTPVAQVVGWGTPTGFAVVHNFPGASATLVQTSTAVAQIIKDLKALGIYGS